MIWNKFSIPINNDLLDELSRTKFFVKQYFCSSYYLEIHVNVVDNLKTSFKTHEEHYEFSVGPFSLTNAPSTCQHLMNVVAVCTNISQSPLMTFSFTVTPGLNIFTIWISHSRFQRSIPFLLKAFGA